EEEVCRPAVVTVLEHLGERELEQALVEPDGPLDVAADEGDVVHAARRRRGPFTAGPEVPGLDLLPAGGRRVPLGPLEPCLLLHALGHGFTQSRLGSFRLRLRQLVWIGYRR